MQAKNQSNQPSQGHVSPGASSPGPSPQDAGELSETELDAVAGGGFDLLAWLKSRVEYQDQ